MDKQNLSGGLKTVPEAELQPQNKRTKKTWPNNQTKKSEENDKRKR
jgi:hypothetical protein